MHVYRTHTIESAPEKSRPTLQSIKERVGFIPNLGGTMAESPVLLGGFFGALTNFQGGTLTPAQRQVLLLTNAVANACTWAVAYHSTQALREGVAVAEV